MLLKADLICRLPFPLFAYLVDVHIVQFKVINELQKNWIENVLRHITNTWCKSLKTKCEGFIGGGGISGKYP